MTIRRSLIALFFVGVLGVGAPAQADPITGSFALVSTFVPVNASTGATTDLASATGIDFQNLWGPDPTGYGQFLVVGATDDFAPLLFSVGTIKDFAFTGSGGPGFPAPPIPGFESVVMAGLTFNLLTISILDRSTNVLHLSGSGIFSWGSAGYDPTNGTFDLFATSTGVNLALNTASGTGPTPVPEPGSLMLLGSGIVAGIGAMRRRGSLRRLAK